MKALYGIIYRINKGGDIVEIPYYLFMTRMRKCQITRGLLLKNILGEYDKSYGENEMNTPILKTERLILRKFTQDDMESLYQIYSDEEVNQFLPWFALKNMDEARTFFEERYAAKYAQPQAYAYAICLKKDNYPIGYIKVDMEEHLKSNGSQKIYWLHSGCIN